jgi:hypothetical protein
MTYRAQHQFTLNYVSIHFEPLGFSLLNGLACASKKVERQKTAEVGEGPHRDTIAKAHRGGGKADKGTPQMWFLALADSGDKLPSMIRWGYIQVA